MKALWHRLLGKLLEIVLSPVGVTVLSELQATSTPPQIDILLLRRTGVQWTPSQMGLLPDGVRDCQARHHLLECKFTESISEESFQQALTYDYLYRQSQQLSPADLQTYVLSAQTPPRSITNAVTPTADKMADTIVGTLVWFAKDV